MSRFNATEYQARFVEGGVRRVSRTVRFIGSQPSWVHRAALIAFAIVIGLPILLLFTVAVFFAVLVFGVLALFGAIGAWFRGLFPKRDGRENVRVIQRDPRR